MGRIYVDLDWVDIDIKCSRKDFKKFKYIEVTDNFRNLVTLTLSVIPYKKDGSKWFSIKGSISDKYYKIEKEPIFYVCLPYLKNTNYNIKYHNLRKIQFISHDFGISNEPIFTKNTYNWKSDNLEITKRMDPGFAKLRFTELQNNNLIGKIFWDDFDEYYDITCHSCKHPEDSCYEALSCPSYGSVKIEKEHVPHKFEKNFIDKEYFTYNNILYKKVPEKEKIFMTYWNEEEYEKIRHEYIDLDERAWTENGILMKEDYEATVKKVNEEWPSFNVAWKNSEKLYRLKNSVNKIYKSTEIKHFEKDVIEKVITKEWHTTRNPKLVLCPVCEELHDIANAYNIYGNLRLIKLYLKNKVYLITHPYVIKNKICKNLSIKFPNKEFCGWKNGSR